MASNKSLLFFSHDYNVRLDIKIKALIRKWKMEGYGVYWAILEDLYNNANALPTHYDLIAEELKVSQELVESVIKDFDLFKIIGEIFISPSAKKRLKAISEKSAKARESALLRWEKDDANAMQSQSERNAIKHNKKKLNKSKLKLKDLELFSDLEKIEKLKSQKDYSPLPDNFILSWQLWIENKKSKFKNEHSEKIAREAFLELSKSDPLTASKIVKNSIANNWAGLFALKELQISQSRKEAISTGVSESNALKAAQRRQELGIKS